MNEWMHEVFRPAPINSQSKLLLSLLLLPVSGKVWVNNNRQDHKRQQVKKNKQIERKRESVWRKELRRERDWFRYLLLFRFLGLDSFSFLRSFFLVSAASSESSMVTTSCGGLGTTGAAGLGVGWGAFWIATTVASLSSSSISLMYAPKHAWRAA